jgi:hypothetical protein
VAGSQPGPSNPQDIALNVSRSARAANWADLASAVATIKPSSLYAVGAVFGPGRLGSRMRTRGNGTRGEM